MIHYSCDRCGRTIDTAHEVRHVVKIEIHAALDVEVAYCDERFTSVQAEAALLEADVRRRDRRSVRDKVAAAIMLQGYLDRQRRDDT